MSTSQTGAYIRADGQGVRLSVRAQPGARRNEIIGEHGDALKIKIAAVPEDGRANTELCAYLAEIFGVTKNSVEVVTGPSSRSKSVHVEGISLQAAMDRLKPYL